MDFGFSDDQLSITQALDHLVERYSVLATGGAAYLQTNAALDQELDDSGFRAIAGHEDLGPLEAVLVIEAVGRIPFAAEISASALVVPMMTGGAFRGPVALARMVLQAPIRFLAPHGTALIDTGRDVRIVDLARCTVKPVPSFFNYPMGLLQAFDLQSAPVLENGSPEAFRQWWQLGLAAEIVGAMDSALSVTVSYVKERKQFGQALGAFQAIQHRLSECAVLVHSARMLVREAAMSATPQAAALAAAFTQDAAARIVYDVHQFHGAIGLTLEYPLHYWTYRLRLLQGELGGAWAQGLDAGRLTWPPDREIGDPLADRP